MLDGIISPRIPRKFVPLLEPARYKGAYGGRGSAKSHTFAELLVTTAVYQPGLHWVCIREVQKSLAQSAKRTIELKIQALGVGSLFDVQKAEIRTPGGFDAATGKYMPPGLIIFQGMQNHTAESIKSLEGYDGGWVEEAQTLSKTSLRLLRPTIRKRTPLLRGGFRNSELWFSWNPRKAKDPVDALLRGDELPPNSIVVQANYMDNPWFGDTTLVDEMEFDKRRDRDTYEHVWLGGYEKHSEARVFKNWRTEWFDAPPPGTRLYAGCDWGFSADPTVLVVCFIIGRTLYIWREAWDLHCGLDRTALLFDKIDPSWSPANAINPNWCSIARNLPIIADNADPQNIDYMKRHGFPRMKPAIKGPGSLESGITFLQSYDIVVHPLCPHVEKELSRYSHKIDKQTDEITSELVDKDNHTIDSVRYAVEDVRRGNSVIVEEFR